MADNEQNRVAETREVLLNAVEVQLAAMSAAVSFWREWMERTSEFVKTTSETLKTIQEADKSPDQVLLEVVDHSRESMRVMTEFPRNAADRFLKELDRIDQKKKSEPKSAAGSPPAKKRTAKSGKAGQAKTKAPAATRRAKAKP